jgi:NAD(P) transhydrogenase subunit alpha
VFVIGAGVAGLQAIATAKRLGAVVSAYDVRPAVKEQVQSVGARFIELPIDTSDAQDKGGYAKAQSEETLAKQRALMASRSATRTSSSRRRSSPASPRRSCPDRRGERHETRQRDRRPRRERGGNCELTRPGEIVQHNGVTIIGTENSPPPCRCTPARFTRTTW